jgi:dTDP-glucose 4,6-dehydratase
MKTILVAGGAGFIGANFVRLALAHRDWRVVVFDKLTYAGNLLNLREVENHPHYGFAPGDITDRPRLRATIAQVRPDVIVNFAAETHVDRSIDGPRDFVETNVMGAFELLEALREYAAQLEPAARAALRFVQVSTDEVYGSLGEQGRSVEEDAYAPNSPYAASKAAADHFVRAYRETYRLPVLITNCTNNYGPYQFPEKLIPMVVAKATAGEPIPIYGDGGNVRDWVFVEDHCAGLLAVLERGREGAKYNIGGDCERTNLELIRTICGVLEELSPAAQNPALQSRGIASYASLMSFVPDRPGHDRRYALDCRLIVGELGWRPRVALADGLRRTVGWYLANREWSERVQSGRYRGERLGLGVAPSGA